MKRLSFKRATLMLVAGALAPALLFAQQLQTIKLTGAHLRASMDVPGGKNQIQICGLNVGEQYTVIALGAVYGQKTTFELNTSGTPVLASTRESGRLNSLQFTAPAACVLLELDARDEQPLTSIPLSLSVNCISCPEDKSWLKKFTNRLESANLLTTGSVDPESLIRNTLIGGDCYEVDSVTAVGNVSSRGTFASGGSSIGLESGVVLSTGDVSVLPGPNTSSMANGGFFVNSADDPDLAALTSGNQFDLSTIEFDFTPTASKVQFDFVFGSEEHCEFINSQYNDVFGFFISGPGITGKQNIALIPGTSTPVTTNNINYLTNANYYVNNNDFFLSPCFLFPTANLDDCELDGWTQVFTAQADVIPCSTYHIKLAIADVGDARYASAVFLRANSFDAGSGVALSMENAAGQAEALEACDTSYIRFARTNSDLSQSETVDFVVSGTSTATPGDDYAPLVSPVVIPAGQSEILVPLVVFEDNMMEGPEHIILELSDACSCDQTEFVITINDKPALEVSLNDVAVCEGNTTVLIPTVNGGVDPVSFAWNTGETTAAITVPVAGLSAYDLTVTDACGETRTASAQVEIVPLVQLNQQIEFCAGESVLVNDSVYTAPTTIINTLPGSGGACDTVQTIVLMEIPLQVLSDTIIFCEGDSVTIGGTVYTESGTVIDTLQGLNGNCDTLITYTLEVLPKPTRSQTITFCPGEPVFIGGTAYTDPGTVVYAQPGQNGACDTLVTYTLEYATPAPSTVAINCPIDYQVTLNGNAPPVVQFDLPTFNSDCPCPGIDLEQTAGLPSGSAYSFGITEVCFVATDSCGNSASCCFDVRIAEAEACDIKDIGCMKYELMSINKNMADEKTYRIRATNNCSQDLVYIAFELPTGLKAVKPVDNAQYISPAGISYAVRNPNFSPFYSIRFSPKLNGSGLSNGESDEFTFTLPPQVSPNYIHVVSKLIYQSYYEAYLNTFYCPVGMDPDFDGGNIQERTFKTAESLPVQFYPNPTTGLLSLDLRAWPGGSVHSRVLNGRGQLVFEQTLNNDFGVVKMQLPERLAEGLYVLELTTPGGERALTRFVLQF
ncbi:MAG: choice-of-anchor L domain-containing protein [Lewinellaceae bacterium]|nr:choice-of-anchor L domain-containing protein [Lewinellaceae bacterium]